VFDLSRYVYKNKDTNFFLCDFLKIKFMLWIFMFSHRCDWGFETCRMLSLIVGWIVFFYISKKYIAFVLKGQLLTLENEYICHIPKEQNPCSLCDWQGSITVHDHHDSTHEIQCRCALRSFILMCSPIFHITNLVIIFNFFISSYRLLQNDNEYITKRVQ